VPPFRPVRAALALSAIGAVLLAAGCGGGGNDGETTGSGTTKAAPAPTASTTAEKRVAVVTAELTSEAVTPNGPKGGRGSATITFNMRSGRACWLLMVTGIDAPLSAHVHRGLAGKLGEVVIPLGDRSSRKGCVLSTRLALRAVALAPGRYYVDVHTRKDIQGAVRGQLRAAPA
jgi:hypothetical protein